jgi:hypothetical protein
MMEEGYSGLVDLAKKYARERRDTVGVGEPVLIPAALRFDENGNRLTRPAAKLLFRRLVSKIVRAEAA